MTNETNRRAPQAQGDGVDSVLAARVLDVMERINEAYRPKPGFASEVGANAFDFALIDLRAALAPKEGAPAAEPVAVKALDDDAIMEIICEVAPWKTEPQFNDLLTYEKTPPLFPQATYDVPSYRAKAFVQAVERRIRAALSGAPQAGDSQGGEDA